MSSADVDEVLRVLAEAMAAVETAEKALIEAHVDTKKARDTVTDVGGSQPGRTLGPCIEDLNKAVTTIQHTGPATAAIKREIAAAADRIRGRAGGAAGAVRAGSPQPTTAAAPTSKRRERPTWLKRMDHGNDFNERDGVHYDLNEIVLETGKRMDSYVHGEEIIERKYTQLAEIEEGTAIGYLRSARRKYKQGNIIAAKPRNQALCPELIGSPTRGKLILKVPVQKAPVPEAVLEAARRLRIEIRQVEDGKDT